MRTALFCLLLTLLSSASAVLSPRDDEIVAAAVKFIVEEEEASPTAKLPLLNRSNFPKSKAVIAQLDAGAARGVCGLDAEHSTSLLNKLGKRNEQSVKWHSQFAELPVRYVTDPTKVDDFFAISLPVIDAEGRYALIGADISDQAGALLLLQNRDDKWLVVAECLEWANY